MRPPLENDDLALFTKPPRTRCRTRASGHATHNDNPL